MLLQDEIEDLSMVLLDLGLENPVYGHQQLSEKEFCMHTWI